MESTAKYTALASASSAGYGVGLGINDDANAPVVVRHSEGELEHEAKELNAESLALRRLIHPKPREPEHRQGVPRQLLARSGRQPVDLDVGGGDSGKAKDTPVLDGHICDPQVVPKLVLSGKLLKKPIDVRVTGPK